MREDDQRDGNAPNTRRGPLWWFGLSVAIAVIIGMTILRQFNT